MILTYFDQQSWRHRCESQHFRDLHYSRIFRQHKCRFCATHINDTRSTQNVNRVSICFKHQTLTYPPVIMAMKYAVLGISHGFPISQPRWMTPLRARFHYLDSTNLANSPLKNSGTQKDRGSNHQASPRGSNGPNKNTILKTRGFASIKIDPSSEFKQSTWLIIANY